MGISKARFLLSPTNSWTQRQGDFGSVVKGSPIPFLPFHAPKSHLFQWVQMSCLAQELCFHHGLNWVWNQMSSTWMSPVWFREHEQPGSSCLSQPSIILTHLKLPFLGWTSPESSSCEVPRRYAKNQTSGPGMQALVENNLAVMFLHTLHISNGMALSLQHGFSQYHFHLVPEPEFVNHLHMCSVHFKSNYFRCSPNCWCIK